MKAKLRRRIKPIIVGTTDSNYNVYLLGFTGKKQPVVDIAEGEEAINWKENYLIPQIEKMMPYGLNLDYKRISSIQKAVMKPA